MQIIECNISSSFEDGAWVYIRGKIPNNDIGKLPILFAHGATFSPSSGYDLPLPWKDGKNKSMMDIFVEYGYPCFFLDFRGVVGRSYIPEFMKIPPTEDLINNPVYSTHEHATQDIYDAVKWITSLGYKKVHGKSWSGGTTSLYNCAVRYPELFETICLYGQKWLDPKEHKPVHNHVSFNKNSQLGRRYSGLTYSNGLNVIPANFYKIWFEHINWLINEYNKFIPRGMIIEMNNSWNKNKILYESNSINVPILMLGSEFDSLTNPKMQYAAYNYINSPKKDIYIIPNSTHYCPVEPKRDEMIGLMLNFYET